MANVTTIIFDYYETLGELSPPMRVRIFDDLARHVGVDLPPGEAIGYWRDETTADLTLRLDGRRPPLDGPIAHFRTFREVWLERSRQLFQHWGVDVPASVGADFYANAHASVTVYPEVAPVLETLRDGYRLAVLSDADSDFLNESLRRNGLSFDAVVVSDQQRAYKPHVSLFREACARLDVQPPQAVFVGDSPWADVEGARHAGLRPVWLDRHHADWPEELEPPAAVIHSLEGLVDVLGGVP